MKYTIYKITCKDVDVPGIYVGSTSEFANRQSQHKSESKNEKNNVKLYNTTRANGGWLNWVMDVVECGTCETQSEAVIRERYYFDKLLADLNTNRSYRSQKEKRLYHVECMVLKKKEFLEQKNIIMMKKRRKFRNKKTLLC